MKILKGLIVVATVFALSAAANGTLIVTANHVDPSYAVAEGGAISNVRMGVDMSVSDGLATFTFTNLSVAPETSAVFKEILLDTADDDTGVSLLWNGTVLTYSNNVRFTYGDSNGLPGFNGAGDLGARDLVAQSSPVKYGLGIGESLEVRFNTSLADGLGIADYLAFFGGGQDTAVNSIGFHAISASTLLGQSLSGSYVPEPTTTAVLVVGGVLALIRRRNRKLHSA